MTKKIELLIKKIVVDRQQKFIWNNKLEKLYTEIHSIKWEDFDKL